MIDFLKSLYKPDIKPLNYANISSENILHNFAVLQSHQTQSELFPVLKSNAYGHGLKEVSEILKWTKGKYICVDSFPEYQIVRKYSWKNILVLWETRNENYRYYDFKKTTFCIYNLETLKYLISLNKKITIHIFINTWMNREGLQENDLRKALSKLKKSKIIVEWVCSHFASADEPDLSFYDKQILEFKRLYEIIISYDFNPYYRHLAASAGTFKMEDNFFNAFRPGMSLFWVNVLSSQDLHYDKAEELKLCMDIYSTVVKIQNLASWEWISYNHTYHTEKETKIAVIPFGYYEWFDRNLSNNYSVKIWKKYYPIRGRICMNLAMIEIWNDKINIWDQVEIISTNKNAINTLYSMAEWSETIAYEIAVKIRENIRKQIK
jgi:alanine racemase